jgi:hypothetical protein
VRFCELLTSTGEVMFCVASNSRVAIGAYIEAVLVVVAIVVIVVAVIGVSSNGSMGLRP